MGRPFYPTEVDDPDLDWLVSNFLYERPDYIPVESGPLPLMLMPYVDGREDETTELPADIQVEPGKQVANSEG
jgi:hypothetical protein